MIRSWISSRIIGQTYHFEPLMDSRLRGNDRRKIILRGVIPAKAVIQDFFPEGYVEVTEESIGIKEGEIHARKYDGLDKLFGKWAEEKFVEIQAGIVGERRIHLKFEIPALPN